jgi:glycosyltransferase A (GT-A) superfamily protein (DUF2064 family)
LILEKGWDVDRPEDLVLWETVKAAEAATKITPH